MSEPFKSCPVNYRSSSLYFSVIYLIPIIYSLDIIQFHRRQSTLNLFPSFVFMVHTLLPHINSNIRVYCVQLLISSTSLSHKIEVKHSTPFFTFLTSSSISLDYVPVSCPKQLSCSACFLVSNVYEEPCLRILIITISLYFIFILCSLWK